MRSETSCRPKLFTSALYPFFSAWRPISASFIPAGSGLLERGRVFGRDFRIVVRTFGGRLTLADTAFGRAGLPSAVMVGVDGLDAAAGFSVR
ncbi:MAG: hypothetical protein ACJ8KU_00245 [Chthoniobacterales bacterium]